MSNSYLNSLAEMPSGMRCPRCGSDNLQVKDSRPTPGAIRRRRACDVCDHRFTTLELPVDGVAGLDGLIDFDSQLQALGANNLALLRALVNQMQANIRNDAQPMRDVGGDQSLPGGGRAA
jgi:hypothetical protein